MKICIATSLVAMAALELAAAAPVANAPHVPGDCIAEQTIRWYRKAPTGFEHKIPVPHHRSHEHKAMLKRDVSSSQGGLTDDELQAARKPVGVPMRISQSHTPLQDPKHMEGVKKTNEGKGARLEAKASAGTDGVRVGFGRGRPVEKRGRKTKALKHKRPVARPKPKVAQSREKSETAQPWRERNDVVDKTGQHMRPLENTKKRPAEKKCACKTKALKHRKKRPAKTKPKAQPQARPADFDDTFVEKSSEAAAEELGEKVAEEAVEREQG